MRRPSRVLLLAVFGTPGFVFARLEPVVCGTHAEKAKEELFLHRQVVRRRAAARIADRAIPVVGRDIGQVALIEDSNGVVGRRNPFDLNGKTLRFLPTQPGAAGYRFELADVSYDQAAASAGTLVKLGDDDSHGLALPFPFPFFGHSYQQIFVNSDGNATFMSGDADSTDRSFGRFTGGLPRIAPLFTDLDPTAAKADAGVFVTSEAERFVVSWVGVPLYSQFGTGIPETFQMRLYPDGRIEFAWPEVSNLDAVVGIAPGRLQGNSSILSFSAGSSLEFTAAVGERFSQSDSVDIVGAAQRFFATHDDAYDYLVVFNSEGIAAAPGAVAYEVTVRNQRTGFGDNPVDIGQDFGSSRRLQAVLNMGPLNQYPLDPNAVVPARFLSRDTPLTLLGHEAGHLFLAYASVKDPNDPRAQPMLGRQLAHWSFLFNSEASYLEGNRIQDNGPDASPRFKTIATVEGYAPLDQYLMGFRAPEEVPEMFLVTDSPNIASGSRSPQVGVAFDGKRRDIGIQELIDAVGRRTPDSTVAQRRFRFAFLLVVPAGSTPPADQIAQLESYRSLFAGTYERATSGRASAETTLKHALHLSAFPAAGLLDGGLAVATVSLDAPVSAPLLVVLNSDSGQVALPPSITLPAGATQGYFFMMGLQPGVATITTTTRDPNYEMAFAKIQVADSVARLQLQVVSSDPVILRVTDINNLPYPNILVKASVSSGALDSSAAISDAGGLVGFRWSPAREATAVLSAGISGGPTVEVILGAR